jgi:hypothetical protein
MMYRKLNKREFSMARSVKVKIKLDTDDDMRGRIEKQDQVWFEGDVYRYIGEKIIFNGREISASVIKADGDPVKAQGSFYDNATQYLGINARENPAFARILLGFHQVGFSTVTLTAVTDIARLNGYTCLDADKVYTDQDIRDYETMSKTKAVKTRTWHEMNTEGDSDNILVTEHVQMLYQGEVCGTFKSKTRFDASGGAEYLGTEMELTGEGKKIIPDTRSLLTKIVEAVKKVFNKITYQDPPISAFNFFAAKQDSEGQPGPVDERTPLLT